MRPGSADAIESLGRESAASHLPAIGEQSLDDREAQVARADHKGSRHQARFPVLAAETLMDAIL
jgi:hypothetical protein